MPELFAPTPQITDTQKSCLGLTINTPGGRSRRIPRPRTQPNVWIEHHAHLLYKVRLRDPQTPTRRSRSEDVALAAIYIYVGDAPPRDFSDWKMLEIVTRMNQLIELPTGMEPGATVWVIARWLSLRDEAGHWAKPFYTFAPMRLQAKKKQQPQSERAKVNMKQDESPPTIKAAA